MKSQIHPQPDPTDHLPRPILTARQLGYRLMLGLLILLFIFAASITLWLAYHIFQPQVSAIFQVPNPTFSATATPACINSSLSLGPYTYPLDVITPPEAGTIPILAKPAGTAWHLSDTAHPLVVIFVPAIGSLDMQSALNLGDELVVQLANCQRQAFTVTGFQQGIPETKALFDQSAAGIVIIVQPVGGKTEYVIDGQ